MAISDPKILYLVHDLADPAVSKRARMLRDGGARVIVAGFRRTAEPVTAIAGCQAVDLGRTYNGAFIQRIGAVLREAAWLARHRRLFAGADIVIARNLEMLAIAVRGRALCRRPLALVYENLDIHRLLLGDGLIGSQLRSLEGRLANQASALITSSPAYIEEYFNKISRVRLPVRIVENKVYLPDNAPGNRPPPSPRPPGPPWRIGWFGNIRCRKSLRLLRRLVQHNEGRIELIIRGCPARDHMTEFDRLYKETPGIRFAGAYRNPEDLPAMYGSVHFTWAIDMYEEGGNGLWLLPNRIYEGGLYNAVPLIQENVETGRFLNRLGTGVTFGAPLEESLHLFFRTLTAARYRALEERATALPSATWRYDRQDAQNLVGWLSGLAAGNIIEERAA